MKAVSSFNIGNIEITNPLILAPMLGITNHSFRTICKEAGGCGLVSTEMLGAKPMLCGHKRTLARMDWTQDEYPVSAQVFGADPGVVAEAARCIEAAGANIIEINMGCPSSTVIGSGSGSDLLRDLHRAETMIKAVIDAVKVPVLVKTRRGWCEKTPTAIEVAKMVETNGGAGITVHGRTAVQRFRGEAEWEIIGQVKESVGIPVIGNGDVRTPEDARHMFELTGCDGVMIGRAAQSNPWIFNIIHTYLTTGVIQGRPDPIVRINAAKRHATLLIGCVGERRGSNEMRGHIERYLSDAPFMPQIRPRIITAKSLCEIEEILDDAISLCS